MIVRLIKLAVSLVVAGADALLGAAMSLVRARTTPGCVVLYYHAVRHDLRERFAGQMDILKALSVPIDIEGSEDLPPGRRYSAVTFDDGFMSVIDIALPELKKRSIPCVMFFPSGSLGSNPKWIKPPHEDASEVVGSPEVVRELAREPLVRIASHSQSHPNFSRLDDQQAREEFVSSREALQSLTGMPVAGFSFPHGAHTRRSLELALECGYRRVYLIEPMLVRNPRHDTVIGRVRVEPYDWPIEFRLKILGAYRWMVPVSAFKRGVRLLLRGRPSEHLTQNGT